MTAKLLNFSIYMDGCGPQGINAVKASNLGSSLDGFGQSEKNNSKLGLSCAKLRPA